MDELSARTLLGLVKMHKIECEDPECDLTMMSLMGVYATLVKRPLTDEEKRAFM